MPDIDIRTEGVAGRITLNRPDALNALTYDMCLAIEAALDGWKTDPAVAFLLIDAAGERAFCAGGDIAEMYARGKRGDYAYGQQFWRDEYRMNAKLFEFPKPVISFMQGFTMGGGVGVGCHGSHRIICDNSQIAMPECGIGLVPDVGGSLLLAQAPGRTGEYLGITASRMGPADAIFAGFADYHVPRASWDALKAELTATGNWKRIDDFTTTPPPGDLARLQPDISRHFGGETLGDIIRSLRSDALRSDPGAFATGALEALLRNAPLSMGCAVEIIHRLRGSNSVRRALELEYRFTYRALEHADFIEGIRAAIIDKDRAPNWRHPDAANVPAVDISHMLMPLGAAAFKFSEDCT